MYQTDYIFNLFFDFFSCFVSSGRMDIQWNKCGETRSHIFCKVFVLEGLTGGKYLDKLLQKYISKNCRKNNVRRSRQICSYCVKTDICYSDVHFIFRTLRVAVLTYLKECIFFKKTFTLKIHIESYAVKYYLRALSGNQ